MINQRSPISETFVANQAHGVILIWKMNLKATSKQTENISFSFISSNKISIEMPNLRFLYDLLNQRPT